MLRLGGDGGNSVVERTGLKNREGRSGKMKDVLRIIVVTGQRVPIE